MRCLDDIICEARCCAAMLGAKYAHALKYGEETDELKWNFRKIHSYILTLNRNHTTVKYKKELRPVTSVNFSALEKKNSFLSLRNTQVVTCVKEEISPCLSDSEIDHIVEQIKLLCANCNCNC
jgi:hypothetical protein